jgi:hypothetical protein
MPKKDTSKTLSKLPKPSRFLLADENWEDYEYRLQCLVEEEKPANMLEYRQLELITRCDIDIDRQHRMISQHLNPLGEAESKGAEIIAEWHRQALMHPDAWERQLDEEACVNSPRDPVEMPDGDERLTPLIANRYAKQRALMAIHQHELGAADRRRRQAIAMLFEMQDRRKRAAVPDAEIVGAGDG